MTFAHRLLIRGTFFANLSNYRYVTSVNVGDVANSACVATQQGKSSIAASMLVMLRIAQARQCFCSSSSAPMLVLQLKAEGGRGSLLLPLLENLQLGAITRITRLLRITRIAGLIFKDNHKSFQRSLFTQITNHSFDFEASGFSPSHPCKLPQFFLDAISCKFDISDLSHFHF